MLVALGLREYQDFKKDSDKTWNRHDYWYEVLVKPDKYQARPY